MKRNTIEDVRKYIEIESESGCKLLSTKYVNSKTKLLLKCTCGKEFSTNFSNFKSLHKHYCEECSRRKGGNPFTYEEFKQFVIKNSNCELLSDFYINERTKLKFRCKCGNEFETEPRTFKNLNKRQCGVCGRKETLKNQTKSQEQFTNEVYELTSEEYSVIGEYKNSKVKIKIKHNCELCNNYEFDILPDSFLRGTRCPKCSIINHTGEKHPRYNPLLTDKDREKRDMQNGEIRKWTSEIFKRDNYTCKCCKKKGNTFLNAHHLNSWNKYKELRFEINNGITLCEDCHKKFHHIYGYGDNTELQFLDFLNKTNII